MDKLTPTQVLWQVAHAWQDWKNDGVALSFAEHLILRAAKIDGDTRSPGDIIKAWHMYTDRGEEAARREVEQKPCRWCAKLAGCTGACGERKGDGKPRVCTEVYHGALCIFDCGDGPCKHAATEQKPNGPAATGSDPFAEREGLGSAATCHAASDGECTWAECPQEKDGRRNYQSSCPLLDSAPFRLEVGKEYARRDGTGPVPIVDDVETSDYPMRGAGPGEAWQRNGAFIDPANPNPRDLVSLWQAEAPQPTPAMQCAKCGPQGCSGACLEKAPQTDAGDTPKTCDGKEQEAFEAWAKSQHMNMEEHPLHYLFLDQRTGGARDGWRAALAYCRPFFEAQARTIKAFELEHGGRALSRAQLRAERDALKAQLAGQNEVTIKQGIQLAAEQRRVARLEDALRKIEHVWTVTPIPDPDRPGYFQPLFDEPIKETLTLVHAAREGDKTNAQ